MRIWRLLRPVRTTTKEIGSAFRERPGRPPATIIFTGYSLPRPEFIDGLEAGSGDDYPNDYGEITATQVAHPSSNVIIGDTSIDETAGEQILEEYGVFNGWHTVGYVSDAGRGLPMHRHGNGWEQNFTNHEGPGGIYVPDSVGDDAFWVLPVFWTDYDSLGGATGFLKYPIDDAVFPCPQGSPDPCDLYQDFECGFMWQNGSSVFSTETCPYAGLFALTTASTNQYRHLAFGGSSWDTIEGTNGNFSPSLKTFGDFMIHRTGTGTGGGFRVSTDGGETWTATPKPTDDTAYRAIDADLCSDGRLWMLWQKSSATNTNVIRLYTSDDFGENFTLQHRASLSGLHEYAGQFNGGLSCHESDADKVAVVVQRGTKARVRFTLNGGANWTNSSVGSLANAYRIVWGGDRLFVIADISSQVRIYRNDNPGTTGWTSTPPFGQVGGNRHDHVEIVRTPVGGLLFAFAFEAGDKSYNLRSTDNGDTWEPMIITGSTNGIRGMIYDADSDHLYLGRASGDMSRLSNASTREWTAAFSAGEWVSLPGLGATLALRALALDGQGSLGLLGP